MVSFSLRQRIFLLKDPSPVPFHLSQFGVDAAALLMLTSARHFARLEAHRRQKQTGIVEHQGARNNV